MRFPVAVGALFLGMSAPFFILGSTSGKPAASAPGCPPLPPLQFGDLGECKPLSHVEGPDGKIYMDFSCEGGAHLLLPFGFNGA